MPLILGIFFEMRGIGSMLGESLKEKAWIVAIA